MATSREKSKTFITGYSLRAPASANPREFYEHLKKGQVNRFTELATFRCRAT